jgi:protein farnesyltransferase subunit beta
MQGSEIELGGFKGRTNKLVDGCYSWWIGGSFPLLEALGIGGPHGRGDKNIAEDDSDSAWADVDGEPFCRYRSIDRITLGGQIFFMTVWLYKNISCTPANIRLEA